MNRQHIPELWALGAVVGPGLADHQGNRCDAGEQEDRMRIGKRRVESEWIDSGRR